MEDMESQIEQLRANRCKKRMELDYEDDDMRIIDAEGVQKKDDGAMGVLLFQCIIVVIIAIIYVLIMTLSKPLAYEIKNIVLDKNANDFSFKDKVYDTVGDAITYLNELKPISIEEGGGDVATNEAVSGKVASDGVASENTTSGGVSSGVTSSETQTSSQAASENENGAGGEPNPVAENGMPANATFAPIIYTGPITFPIAKDYHITSTFGFREHPSQAIEEFHTAVDIGALKGTPIRAAADGVVIKSEKSGSLGNHIIIDHSNGFFTIYGHCDKLIAKEGARIREGEIIAKVGSTGDSTGNHLHFGMKKDDLYFDPSYIFKEELNVTV